MWLKLNNNKKKRYIGLIGLYTLLITISSLIQQVKYYGKLSIFLALIVIILLIILWKYLLRNKIISINWSSLPFDQYSHKSERMFLFSLATIISPVLRLQNLSTYDVIITVLAILFSLVCYSLNEFRIAKMK